MNNRKNNLLKDWKKVKFSSTFRRKVSNNFSKILNLPISASIINSESASSSVHQVFISNALKNNTQTHREGIFQQNTEQDIQTENDLHNNGNRSCTSSESCPSSHIIAENISNNYEIDDSSESRSKWLIEFEDDDLSPLCNEVSEYTKNEEMRIDVKKWANDFNITQRAVKEILKLINKRLPNALPVDPRTLMRTPTTIVIHQIGEGLQQYWHQGLEFILRNCYKYIKNMNISNVSININIDGLPIYKSSSAKLPKHKPQNILWSAARARVHVFYNVFISLLKASG